MALATTSTLKYFYWRLCSNFAFWKNYLFKQKIYFHFQYPTSLWEVPLQACRGAAVCLLRNQYYYRLLSVSLFAYYGIYNLIGSWNFHKTLENRICMLITSFPVWFRNRSISAGLQPVLSHTEKLYKTSNYRQF